MTTTLTDLPDLVSDDALFVETAVAATAINNLLKGTGTIYSLDINNGASQTVYLKIYDDLGPTIGTTDPIEIIPIATGVREVYDFGKDGLEFSNGISLACVQEAGTAGTTAPSGGNVAVRGWGKK